MGSKMMSGDVFRVVWMFLDFFGPSGVILDQKSGKNFFDQKIDFSPKRSIWTQKLDFDAE
jgi:hypothetical protein